MSGTRLSWGVRVRNELHANFEGKRQPGECELAALALMVDALHHLDNDAAIPAIVGARLQHAIDTLCQECDVDPVGSADVPGMAA